MPDPVVEDIEKEVDCDDLFDCIHGLTPLDEACFQLLVGTDQQLAVDEIASRLDCGRTTAYRSVQRLHDAGYVERHQTNYDDGGYFYTYRAADPDEIANEMQQLVNEWYAQTGQLIRQFRNKYDGESQPVSTEG